MTAVHLNGKGSPSAHVALYRDLGLNVIKADGKHPTGQWADRRHLPTGKQYEALARHAERGNPVFLIAGTSSQAAVLDLDTPEAVDLWRERLGSAWDLIPRDRTPSGGHHLYFALRPGQVVKTINRRDEGWELKAEGAGAILPTGNDDRRWEVSPSHQLPAYDDYLADHVTAAQVARDPTQQTWKTEGWTVPYGEHDVTLTELAGGFRHYFNATEDEMRDALVAFADRFEDAGEDLVTQMIPKVARSMAQRPPGEIVFTDRMMVTRRTATPVLDDAALHGPIGDYVRFLAPRTEAHPAALLMQALAVFGNRTGAEKPGEAAPGFRHGASYHRLALYVMVIGASGDGAKGDSWEWVHQFFRTVDPTFEPQVGVQTGEGYISALADATAEDAYTTVDGERIQHERKGGQADRRFFDFEPEFARVLHVAARPGTTNKDIIRDLWDGGSTGKITSGERQKVSEVTLSIVGHITPAELERDLDPVDLMSGFGNRFVFCWTKRTQDLAIEHPVPSKKLREFAEPLKEALEFAHFEAPEDYEFDSHAMKLWLNLVSQWKRATRNSALMEALAGRDKAQVRRLAVIYAVADCAPQIRVEHLRAANAVWDYSMQTVEYLFSSRVGDKDADRMIRVLKDHPSGISDNEIAKALGGHWSSQKRERALGLLQQRGLATSQKIGSGRGRPKRLWVSR